MNIASTSNRTFGGFLTPDQIKALDELKNNEKNNKLLEGQKMGKDQFMKILITQLTHQNPLEPLQDKDFIAQMAQFSALEQTKSINESLAKLSTEIKDIKEAIVANNNGKDNEKLIKALDKIDKTLNTITNDKLKEITDAINLKKAKEGYQ